MRWWKNLSISKKLYTVVGIMAVLVAGELLTLRFAMRTLSAVRAFVGGEGLWSKAQKDAAVSLQRYVLTRNEQDYLDFLDHLKVPEGDRIARVELMKPKGDRALIRQGFLQGRIHPDDIEPMVEILERFHFVSYLDTALKAWSRADELLVELKGAGESLHRLVQAGAYPKSEMDRLLLRIRELNIQLTTEEENFSSALGEGSRWLEQLIITLLFMAVLTVESISFILTFVTSRSISLGLNSINAGAKRIAQGDFSTAVAVTSQDDIGRLATSINQMGLMLQKSYGELEVLVEKRTRKLSQLAEENAQLYDEANSALQMRDEFLSIASHELRTPLTSLNLFLQMVQRTAQRLPSRDSLPEQLLVNLDLAEKQGRKLAELLDDLLDLTKIRAGRLEIHPVTTDLRTVVSETIAASAQAAAVAGSAIHLEAPEAVVGIWDPLRLNQVVTNLLSNAIKYGQGKPIQVAVLNVENGQNAQIVVKDRGIGIPEELHEKIFERFERGAVGAKSYGLGLGLYIVRQILEAHQGTIHVESQLDQGSSFTVEIPKEV